MEKVANEWSWVRAARRALHYQGGTLESSARAGVCSCSHRLPGWGGGARATPLQIRRHRRRRRHVRRTVRPSTARRDARLHSVPAVWRHCARCPDAANITTLHRLNYSTTTLRIRSPPLIEFTVSKWSYTGFFLQNTTLDALVSTRVFFPFTSISYDFSFSLFYLKFVIHVIYKTLSFTHKLILNWKNVVYFYLKESWNIFSTSARRFVGTKI